MKKNTKPVASLLASLKAAFGGSADTTAKTEENAEVAEANVEQSKGAEANAEGAEDDVEQNEGAEANAEQIEGAEASTQNPADAKKVETKLPEMVSLTQDQFDVLSNAAQKWEANEERFNTLVAWEASMRNVGAGVRGDAADNKKTDKKVSSITAKAQQVYNKRAARQGKN